MRSVVTLEPLEGDEIVTVGGGPAVTATLAEHVADRPEYVTEARTDPVPVVVAEKTPPGVMFPMFPVTDQAAETPAISVVPFQPLAANA